MPRRKICEYQTKQLLKEHIPRLSSLQLELKSAQIDDKTDINQFNPANETQQWIFKEKLVVKPDMLFGKRGKHNLVLLNATFEDAKLFLNQKMGREISISGLKGAVTRFIIEPFVPHTDEYYLSILCARDENTISFSECGGIEIEENWDQVRKLGVPVGANINNIDLDLLFKSCLETDKKLTIIKFIRACYQVFEDLHFHFLEMNPFTVVDGKYCHPLDARAELDDCAQFKNNSKWIVDKEPIEFPEIFGVKILPQEQLVRSIDERTGASLKLTILNPMGRIWAMVAGGGASVIYADTVADLGYGHELGNYGEYSGDPSEDETYQYANTLLSLATNTTDNLPRSLIIGGAIANFTDVAVTFAGIIRALKENAAAIRNAHMKVFVRRGGPNYQIGLKRMKELEKDIGVPFEVYGPEMNMTSVVQFAIDWIKTTPNGRTVENVDCSR